MVHYKDYVAGWLDSSIADFMDAMPKILTNTNYALITCIDSNANAKSVLDRSPEFKVISAQAKTVSNGILLPTKLLVEAQASHPLFFGFDEVSFFPNDNIKPKPTSISLVGPARIDLAKIKKLERWMAESACSLALGDGGGLNFIVKAQGIVKLLLGHSLTQPQPSGVVASYAEDGAV